MSLIFKSQLLIQIKKIQENFLTIKRHVDPCEVMVVLKANAYGLGVGAISKALYKVGAKWFGVANLKEALEIKAFFKKKVNILILGSLFKEEIKKAIENNFILAIENLELAKLIDKEAKKQKKQIIGHLVIDTGMGRLGIFYEKAFLIIDKILSLSSLKIEGVYSHLSNANLKKDPQTQKQKKRFDIILEKYQNIVWKHLANSDGINNFEETYYNMVRTGINLYGVFDLLGGHAYTLKKTLTLFSSLISLRMLPKGSTIGYGATCILKKDTLVGTIPLGYADGIPYIAGNKGKVLISGEICPIIGRISMDYITVDVSRVKKAKIGDRVVLIGDSEDKSITVEDWACLKESHPYDIICSLGKRIERKYL